MSAFLKRNKMVVEKILMICLVAVTAFVFLTKSPIHIWRHGECGTDSSVFQTVALMMEHGFMPYRDSFDHKGPLLYLINYVGRQIAPYRGVWLIEYGFMVSLLSVLYKIARLKCGKFLSCVSVLTASALLDSVFDEGNLTEEYAMLFIAIAIYIFLDYFINGKINRIRLFLCGFSFGAVFLLRPNMISVWIVFCLAVFAECLLHGKRRELLFYLLYFLAGAGGMLAPVMVWMAIKGVLVEGIQSYILFNFFYCSVQTTFSEMGKTCFFFLKKPIIMLAVIACIYLAIRREHVLYGIYLCYMGCTAFLISLSGMRYAHYGMILIPAVIFPIASLLGDLGRSKWNYRHVPTVFMVLWLMAYIIMPVWIPRISALSQIYENRTENEYKQLTEDVCWIVEQETAPDEKISVCGNWNIIYILSGRMHATRYSYQVPIANISPEIKEQYFGQLEQELPKIIVVQQAYDDRIIDFCEKNQYSCIWVEDEAENPVRIFKYIN